MIFIDTGAFLARYLARDQYHEIAKEAFTEIARQNTKVFTSSFVLDETITLLARRAGSEFAAQRARLIYASESLSILRPDKKIELSACDILEKFSDQKVSFTDCISFALMRYHKLHKVLGFDKHFQIAGFELFPQQKPVSL